MAVPLGHKNHRQVRGNGIVKSVFKEKYLHDNNYVIVGKKAALSLDRKTFVYLKEDIAGTYRIPSGVEVIATNSLKKTNASIISIPDSVKKIEEGSLRNFFNIEYQINRIKHEFLGDVLHIRPKRLILKGRKEKAGFTNKIVSLKLPPIVKAYLLQRKSVNIFDLQMEMLIDNNGVRYSADGKNLEGMEYGLVTYKIPEGVESILHTAIASSITDITLPKSLKVLKNYLFDNRCHLETVRFVSPKPPVVKSICEAPIVRFHNCIRLRRIIVPAGCKENYKQCLGEHYKYVIEE